MNVPMVIWNSYADVVDRYFEGETADEGPVPRQEFPATLADVLAFLDRIRDEWQIATRISLIILV